MSQETETPAETSNAATQENALPTSRATLIGTLTTPKGAQALVRTSTGDILHLSKGDSFGTSTVMAIEPGVLHLAREGRLHRLKMPGG